MKPMTDLIAKYDVQAPRYTSYPTVPHWKDSPTSDQWITFVQKTLTEPTSNWSIYMHIPFCESLCTFCGCNTSITKNKKMGTDYVQLLEKEALLYFDKIPQLLDRPVENLHLGGGTPTFLSPADLERLLLPLLAKIKKSPHFEASIEVDPRRTTKEQLQTLRKMGFNRVSLGVQDLDANVQRLINRHQTFEQTERITSIARDLGYVSVNWDLIYGLPQQTLASIDETVRLTIQEKPDRIALYSFALVPWIKPQQRLFTDEDLPAGEAKRKLYERAREKLLEGGYLEVGMDHFALATDALHTSQKESRLHRNFMGYTDQRTDVMLGWGVSAISESPDCFHQNEKVLAQYQRKVLAGEIPTLRGHVLTTEERTTRKQILELMTQWKTDFLDSKQKDHCKNILTEMASEGLLEMTDKGIQVLEVGKPFLRNICMVFDPNISQTAISTTSSEKARMFSRSI